MCLSQPKAPAYVAPNPVQIPVPAPVAPSPYYDKQEQDAANSNALTNDAAAKSRLGRSALKIDLVNNTGSTSSSGVNTVN